MFSSVSLEKNHMLKSEPVVTYNHMEEDEQGQSFEHSQEEDSKYPISLYMILIVDAILVSAIVFFTFTVIF